MDHIRGSGDPRHSDRGHGPLEEEIGNASGSAAAIYRKARLTFAELRGAWDAVSPSRRRRYALRLLGLTLFVGVIALVIPGRKASGLRYLIAQREVASGSPVTNLHFGIVAQSETEGPVYPDTITDQDIHLLKGSLVNLPLRRGELLRRSHLKAAPHPKSMAEQIPLGSRAYLLENTSAAKVKAGDRVDITFLAADRGGGIVNLGEDVLVLDSDGQRELTLALTLDDLEGVELAKSRGQIGVVMRNPRDTKRKPGRRRARFSGKRPDGIQIIHEGGEG